MSLLRIGCVGGHSGRLNERAIDDQWVRYLGEHTELVPIPPLSFVKLFGGRVDRWLERFPESLDKLAASLQELAERHQVNTFYMNLPFLIPYLLMARSYAGLDIGFLFITHSVGSPFWLRQWLAVAPWLTERDVLLASTPSSREALLQISDRYQMASLIPLCIEQLASETTEAARASRTGRKLLSIGRLEDVKNIDVLLECFASIREHAPHAELHIAGEYTGHSSEQIERYREKLKRLMEKHELQDSVIFHGPVEGEAKIELFRTSDLLINLSTDPGETFGFNLLEAKAWGIPVVCTNWNGFRDIVEDGVDGLLVDVSWDEDDSMPQIDNDLVIHHTLRLLNHSIERNVLSANAIKAAERYDYKRIVPEIVQALEHASKQLVYPIRDAKALAMTPVNELREIYRNENLHHLLCMLEKPVSIASGPIDTPMQEWMPQAKAIIAHFAGRCSHAKH
ncbi:glycosyl transferase group 1 [Paenibacillus curdlanolyticus YK9]|uniref:Glycosyl transferase group 1 n=1 Tax=Paenibacillus curdlanolyticus YK9 TaxID=717606 RepID=E0I5B6_9BACL|nr:glycosyltransferase [Paenibacillus curdlanolyticus]EFM12158.1 glycosyl transferase group 1 [Paenibacillus curdlanolyticus YK9]